LTIGLISRSSGAVSFLALQQLFAFVLSVVEDSQTMMILCGNRRESQKIEISALAEGSS
jgi:hypothetical protein